MITHDVEMSRVLAEVVRRWPLTVLDKLAREQVLPRSPSVSFSMSVIVPDRLCGLVVRVSGYRSRGAGFDSRRFQIF
jgi:hypothetical protein